MARATRGRRPGPAWTARWALWTRSKSATACYGTSADHFAGAACSLHVWRPVPGTSGAARRWRCEACGTRTGSLESRRRERCRFPVYAAAPLVDDPAYQLVQEVERDAGHGHFLNFTSPFVWCSRCGRHTSATGRATGLRSVCPGRPLGRGGATRLSWLKQDCHPDTKAALLAKRVQLGQVWKPPEPARAQPASLPPRRRPGPGGHGCL